MRYTGTRVLGARGLGLGLELELSGVCGRCCGGLRRRLLRRRVARWRLARRHFARLLRRARGARLLGALASRANLGRRVHARGGRHEALRSLRVCDRVRLGPCGRGVVGLVAHAVTAAPMLPFVMAVCPCATDVNAPVKMRTAPMSRRRFTLRGNIDRRGRHCGGRTWKEVTS